MAGAPDWHSRPGRHIDRAAAPPGEAGTPDFRVEVRGRWRRVATLVAY
jgi:hypothetical protein